MAREFANYLCPLPNCGGWKPPLLEIAERLFTGSRAQAAPSVEVNDVRNEPHGAVAKRSHHAAGMPAAGRDVLRVVRSWAVARRIVCIAVDAVRDVFQNVRLARVRRQMCLEMRSA